MLQQSLATLRAPLAGHRVRTTQLQRQVTCTADRKPEEPKQDPKLARREIMLNSVSGIALASVFQFTGTRPNNLGLKDYGTFKSLGLCPPTPNCISTAEEANDVSHFVPAWTYNVPGKPKKTKAQAVAELKEVVASCTEGKFTPTIIKATDNYVNAEFQSSFFGFVDDVEFYFSDDDGGGRVEYRSASRLGESDGDANRKRIRALRKALEKKGWRSVGF